MTTGSDAYTAVTEDDRGAKARSLGACLSFHLVAAAAGASARLFKPCGRFGVRSDLGSRLLPDRCLGPESSRINSS